jgi:two-component system, LytTR family, sensor histidine kinase AlgZ
VDIGQLPLLVDAATVRYGPGADGTRARRFLSWHYPLRRILHRPDPGAIAPADAMNATAPAGPTHPPSWLPFVAGLPISLCMVVLSLPDLQFDHGGAFRALMVGAYLWWSVLLSLILHGLWRRRVSWWIRVPLLLGLTYTMALANSAAAQYLAIGWKVLPAFDWSRLFRGLDGCWLSLIAFCAVHTVVGYYFALQEEQRRSLAAAALARDAELRALRYQLHPHFLFNTLNAISALVVGGQSREATRMIARLGDFLRATLESDGVHEVSLAEELSLAEHYTDIEKARLGERLQLNLNVGPDALRAAVPYLLLQPLIENAIRHGIAPRPGGGRVLLRVARQAQRLQLSLYNDGTARDAHGDESPSAVGLRNVRERLRHLYQNDHRFDIDFAADGGCTVRIDLPFRPAAARAAGIAA